MYICTHDVGVPAVASSVLSRRRTPTHGHDRAKGSEKRTDSLSPESVLQASEGIAAQLQEEPGIAQSLYCAKYVLCVLYVLCEVCTYCEKCVLYVL